MLLYHLWSFHKLFWLRDDCVLGFVQHFQRLRKGWNVFVKSKFIEQYQVHLIGQFLTYAFGKHQLDYFNASPNVLKLDVRKVRHKGLVLQWNHLRRVSVCPGRVLFVVCYSLFRDGLIFLCALHHKILCVCLSFM